VCLRRGYNSHTALLADHHPSPGMAGRNLRQRKKNGSVPAPDPTPPHETQVDNTTSFLTWIMYGFAFIILACLVYRASVFSANHRQAFDAPSLASCPTSSQACDSIRAKHTYRASKPTLYRPSLRTRKGEVLSWRRLRYVDIFRLPRRPYVLHQRIARMDGIRYVCISSLPSH